MAVNAPELRPLGIGEIVDAAIKLYRSHAATLLKLVAIIVVPVQILGALISVSAAPTESEIQQGFIVQDPTAPTVDPTVDLSFFWGFVVAALAVGALSWIATQLATGASLKAVSDAYLGRDTEWQDSLRFAFSKLGSLVWISILTGLLVGLGLIACIAPGVFLWVAWAVAIPALLMEGERGWSALKRSYELVKGRWWQTLGTILLAFVITAVVQFIIGGIFGLAIPAGTDSFAAQFFSEAIGNAISQTITTPFFAAVIALVYFDLRVRKEGFDLELLAQGLGGGPDPFGGGEASGGAGGSEGGEAPEPPAGPGDDPSRPPPTPPRDWRPDPGGGAWEGHDKRHEE